MVWGRHRRRGATCCRRNSGATRTRFETVQEPKNLKACTKMGGRRARKTRCSDYARCTTTATTHMFVSTRVSVDSVARATRRCVGAHRVRRAAAADGHLRALRASTLSHTVRGAVVCAREVAVVCRRFYYVPMIITPPPRYQCCGCGRSNGGGGGGGYGRSSAGGGGTCQSRATGSLARNVFRPFAAAAAVNRLPRAQLLLYYTKCVSRAARPWTFDFAHFLFILSDRKFLFAFPATRRHRARDATRRFRFSHRIVVGRSNPYR